MCVASYVVADDVVVDRKIKCCCRRSSDRVLQMVLFPIERSSVSIDDQVIDCCKR